MEAPLPNSYRIPTLHSKRDTELRHALPVSSPPPTAFSQWVEGTRRLRYVSPNPGKRMKQETPEISQTGLPDLPSAGGIQGRGSSAFINLATGQKVPNANKTFYMARNGIVGASNVMPPPTLSGKDTIAWSIKSLDARENESRLPEGTDRYRKFNIAGRFSSSDTATSSIAVKPTISEDLSRKDQDHVTKLRYLQRKNEKFGGLRNRQDIILPVRSQHQNDSPTQDIGHEDLSNKDLTQPPSFSQPSGSRMINTPAGAKTGIDENALMDYRMQLELLETQKARRERQKQIRKGKTSSHMAP